MTFAATTIMPSALIDQANPGISDGPRALVNLLDPVLTGVGWVREENALSNGGALIWVYRSPGSSNSFGSDFRIAFAISTTASQRSLLMIALFEGWNTSTKQCSNYAPSVGSTVPSATTFLNPGAAKALTSSGTLNSIGALASIDFSSWTSPHQIVYSVTIDRVIIGYRSNDSGNGWGAQYIGLYDSFMNTTDDPFPICQVGLRASTTGGTGSFQGTAYGVSTREPKQTGSAAANFGVQVGSVGTASPATSGFVPPQAANVGDSYSQKMWLGRVPLLSSRSGVGSVRGLLKDVYVSNWANCSFGTRATFTQNPGNTTQNVTNINGATGISGGSIWVAEI